MTDDTFDDLVDKHKSRPDPAEEEEQQADYLEINFEAHDSYFEGPIGSIIIKRHVDGEDALVRVHGTIGDEAMTPVTPGTAVRVQLKGKTILTGELVDVIDDRPESVAYIVDEDGTLRFARGWADEAIEL